MSLSRCQLHRGERFELTSAQFTVELGYGSIAQQVRGAEGGTQDTSDSSSLIPVPRPALKLVLSLRDKVGRNP